MCFSSVAINSTFVRSKEWAVGAVARAISI
jgi:hypothetical protein